MTLIDINSTEYAGYYKRYIDTVTKGVQLSDAYQKVGKLKKYMEKIPKVKLSYRYDEGKWSIKEVYQHIIDTERVFAYRLFRIGRMDSTSLSGFNQDDFIEPSAADSKSLELLHHEYCTTRANTSAIIHSLSADQLAFVGEASGLPLSPRASAFIILGHEQWHMDIINERYL